MVIVSNSRPDALYQDTGLVSDRRNYFSDIDTILNGSTAWVYSQKRIQQQIQNMVTRANSREQARHDFNAFRSTLKSAILRDKSRITSTDPETRINTQCWYVFDDMRDNQSLGMQFSNAVLFNFIRQRLVSRGQPIPSLQGSAVIGSYKSDPNNVVLDYDIELQRLIHEDASLSLIISSRMNELLLSEPSTAGSVFRFNSSNIGTAIQYLEGSIQNAAALFRIDDLNYQIGPVTTDEPASERRYAQVCCAVKDVWIVLEAAIAAQQGFVPVISPIDGNGTFFTRMLCEQTSVNALSLTGEAVDAIVGNDWSDPDRLVLIHFGFTPEQNS